MPLSTAALWLLALIAVASVAQSACLVMLALNGLKAQKDIESIGRRLTRDLAPLLDDVSRIARNASEISELGVVQARRLDETMAEATHTFDQIVGAATTVVLPVVGRLAALAAGLRVFGQARRLTRRLFR